MPSAGRRITAVPDRGEAVRLSAGTAEGSRAPGRAPGWAVAVPLALLAIQLVLQLAQLRGGVAYLVAALFRDDTFYYLQPAWNAHHLGFVTFDGLHPTNGFHLLWFLVVWVLAGVSPDKGTLLSLTLACCAALNASVHLVVLRTAAALRRPRLAPPLSALCFALLLSTPVYLEGMENSLHFLVSWAVVWQLAVLYRRLEEGHRASLLPLTAVLVLNAWTRADSALLSAVVFAAAVAATLHAARSRGAPLGGGAVSALPAAGLALLGGAVQAGTYWLLAGSPVPVSSLVKYGAFAAEPARGPVAAFAAMATPTFPDLALPRLDALVALAGPLAVASLAVLLAARLLPRLDRWPAARALLTALTAPAAFVLLYLVLAGRLLPETYLALLALATILLWRDAEGGSGVLARVWLTVALAFVAYHALWLHLGMPLRAYAEWYYAPAHLAWLLGIAILGVALGGLPGLPRLRRAIAVGVIPLAVVMTADAASTAVRGYPALPILAARQRAAIWISHNLQPDAVLASWNAGVLGYFCGRTLINLDGLTNSPDYARAILSPDFRIADYLRANRVGWVVDWTVPPLARPGLEPVRVFPSGPGLLPVVLYRPRSTSTATGHE